MVWVLTGPRKKNRPGVQALNGTVIVTSTLWPGASTPADGLKTICPGTLVNANQFRLLWLFDPEITQAKQTKAPFLLQSRCPTILIEDGRKSRTAGAG